MKSYNEFIDNPKEQNKIEENVSSGRAKKAKSSSIGQRITQSQVDRIQQQRREVEKEEEKKRWRRHLKQQQQDVLILIA